MKNFVIHNGKYIIPIFNKTNKNYTRQEIESIENNCRNIFAELQTANDLGIIIHFHYDTEASNIGVINKGIVFDVNFLKQFTKDEIAFIIGHETAHILYRHIEKTNCLSDITTGVHKYILEKTGKTDRTPKANFVFLDAVNKLFEYEADSLGASLAHKAGYKGELSALEKMNDGLTDFANALDEHPMCGERIQMLKSCPYVEYSKDKVLKEFLYLNELALLCKKDNIDYNDFCKLYETERKYIMEAHTNLIGTDGFLRSRNYNIQEMLSRQLFTENIKERYVYDRILNNYTKQLDNVSDVAQIMVVRKDAENLLSQIRGIHKQIKKHSKLSFINSFKNAVLHIKGEENEL